MLLANFVGSDGLIVLVIALVVIFGGSQLPKIARNVGTAGKEFRRAQQESEEEARAEAAAKAATASSQLPPVQGPVAATPTPVATPEAAPAAPAPAAAAPQPSDNVTISRADLEALLEERLGKGGSASS